MESPRAGEAIDVRRQVRRVGLSLRTALPTGIPRRPRATPSSDPEPGPGCARRRWLVVAGTLALIGASLALRVGGLATWLWMDEGIAVGVASHPLREIPGLLRQDGSPPLYYLLLHVWMSVFGVSESATHALSLTISLVTIPTSPVSYTHLTLPTKRIV